MAEPIFIDEILRKPSADIDLFALRQYVFSDACSLEDDLAYAVNNSEEFMYDAIAQDPGRWPIYRVLLEAMVLKCGMTHLQLEEKHLSIHSIDGIKALGKVRIENIHGVDGKERGHKEPRFFRLIRLMGLEPQGNSPVAEAIANLIGALVKAAPYYDQAYTLQEKALHAGKMLPFAFGDVLTHIMRNRKLTPKELAEKVKNEPNNFTRDAIESWRFGSSRPMNFSMIDTLVKGIDATPDEEKLLRASWINNYIFWELGTEKYKGKEGFGICLREIRLSLGFSQREFAEAVGAKQKSICPIEKAHSFPSDERQQGKNKRNYLRIFCDALGLHGEVREIFRFVYERSHPQRQARAEADIKLDAIFSTIEVNESYAGIKGLSCLLKDVRVALGLRQEDIWDRKTASSLEVGRFLFTRESKISKLLDSMNNAAHAVGRDGLSDSQKQAFIKKWLGNIRQVREEKTSEVIDNLNPGNVTNAATFGNLLLSLKEASQAGRPSTVYETGAKFPKDEDQFTKALKPYRYLSPEQAEKLHGIWQAVKEAGQAQEADGRVDNGQAGDTPSETVKAARAARATKAAAPDSAAAP